MFCSPSILLLALVAISGVTLAQDSSASNPAPSRSAHQHSHSHPSACQHSKGLQHSHGFHKGSGAGARPTTFITKAKAVQSGSAMQPFTSNGVLYEPVVVVVTVTPSSSIIPVTPSTTVQSSASIVPVTPSAAIQSSASIVPVTPSTVAQSPAAAASSQAPAASSQAQSNVPKIVPTTPATTAAAPAAATPEAKKPATSAAAAQYSSGSSSSLNTQILQKIMPASSSCAGASAPAECITADAAAPLLVQSYTKYNIASKGAQAAILALIAVESGELKYNQHYNGGTPALTGQGTRNMMSPTFVLQYGQAIYGASAGTNALTVMNKINTNQEDSMASAAWFLATKCPSVLQQFASDPDGAYTQYITSSSCIGTTMSAQRQQYWTAAKAAMGV